MGYNEEANLRELLPTVSWADEIIYIDSFSTDNTAEVCAQHGVRHVNMAFEGFGKLRNRALDLATHGWIVSIDSDERATPEFAEELKQTLQNPQYDAYFVPRRNTFLGRPLQHSGMYPDYRQPQVFRKGALRYREDLVHEDYDCASPKGYFKNFIWQHPWPTLKVMLAKGERYTTLMAEKKYSRGERATWEKLVLNPPAAFFKKLLLQLSILDGMPGFFIAMIHAHYTFVKYAKLWELEHSSPPKLP